MDPGLSDPLPPPSPVLVLIPILTAQSPLFFKLPTLNATSSVKPSLDPQPEEVSQALMHLSHLSLSLLLIAAHPFIYQGSLSASHRHAPPVTHGEGAAGVASGWVTTASEMFQWQATPGTLGKMGVKGDNVRTL